MNDLKAALTVLSFNFLGVSKTPCMFVRYDYFTLLAISMVFPVLARCDSAEHFSKNNVTHGTA